MSETSDSPPAPSAASSDGGNLQSGSGSGDGYPGMMESAETTPVHEEEPARHSQRLAQALVEKAHDVEDQDEAPTGRRLALLMLTALGVVYGDIGTSPLYAVRECFHPSHGLRVSPEAVLGILSLVFWALVMVISVFYCGLVLQADNKGEGGILALMALVPERKSGLRSRFVLYAGLFGAALLYGDGTITPAISVLSAVEGLTVAAGKGIEPWIVPIAVLILIGLFAMQSRGTAGVGTLFGPVMLLWFGVLAVLGVVNLVQEPGVLRAIDPRHAVRFLFGNGWLGFLTLGSVFLVVTGGEALYADMGHFGRRPIRFAWFGLCLPALLLNYFGQGALLLQHPEWFESPFFHMAPGWAQYPLVALSTVAAVIASQAVISGAFSITRQAVQLGYLPRTTIQHTSAEEIGQIYVPGINWLLLVVALAMVLGFRHSSDLAAAYGVAVTGTMLLTTTMLFFVARERWAWRLPLVLAVFVCFASSDAAFFTANLPKVPHGGWVPLVLASGLFIVFTTWKRGREILFERLRARDIPLKDFLRHLVDNKVIRRAGTAVFMTSNPDGTPAILPHHVRHNGVLQERVILLTVKTLEVPYVPRAERVRIERLEQGFVRVFAHCGFMETPTVARIFRWCRGKGLTLHAQEVTFYLGRESLVATSRPGMAIWRERLFAFLSRNSQPATHYYEIPADRVFEIGLQIEL